MKAFIYGFLTLIGSLFVFSIVIVVGFVYSFLYSLWLTVSLKDWKAFFVFWGDRFVGLLSAIGHIFGAVAVGYDVIANVLAGEMLEDITTHKEETTFGEPITVSASIGEIESRPNMPLVKFGWLLSSLLNVVFNQKRHALDSWLIHLKREELNKKYFQPRKN